MVPLAPKAPAAPRDPGRANLVVRWALYAFVFSIPFEYPARTIPLEVHTITGSMFLLFTLIQPGVCYRRAPVVFRWLAVYLLVYAFLSLFVDHVAEAFKFFFNLLLVLFIFWAGCNLMRDEGTARATLASFGVACSVLAVMQILNIGTDVLDSGDWARRTVLAQDPNTTGGNMAVGVVALMGVAYGRQPTAWWLRALLSGLAVASGAALVLGASRGALVALAAGLLLSMLKPGDLRSKARNTIIAGLASVALVVAVFSSDALRSRAEQSLVNGKMAGRELIYPQAWQMFLERPLAGWGPADNTYELGARVAQFKIGRLTADDLPVAPWEDTHNLLLDVTTATGLMGAVPMFTCIALCLIGGWRARGGPHSTTPFAASCVVLLLSMNINWSASKLAWLLFAYAAASGALAEAAQPLRSLAYRRANCRMAGRRHVQLTTPQLG